MNGIMNGIMNRGGCFHNLYKLAKMAIFPKAPVHKKKTHLEGVDPTPQVLYKMAHGYPIKSKLRSYFIK